MKKEEEEEERRGRRGRSGYNTELITGFKSVGKRHILDNSQSHALEWKVTSQGSRPIEF